MAVGRQQSPELTKAFPCGSSNGEGISADARMLNEVLEGKRLYVLETGDCLNLLARLPDCSIDCAITSPPYWRQRIYEDFGREISGAIGSERTPDEYVESLMRVIREVKRVLKPSGTFWLNLGDKFHNGCLMGMPWRVALAMEREKWILRSDIVWDQMKGTQSCTTRFRDMYEHVFQFVKQMRYRFDADAVRIPPRAYAREVDGNAVSATGVTGRKYLEQIKDSKCLTEEERNSALDALNEALEEMRRGEIVDFRMAIRGVQRSFHGTSGKISGRAKELQDKGWYIFKSGSKGSLPSDIWRIAPEDTWRKDAHYAVFPEELLRIPILSTCPEGGIVLDPFSGTGSTVCAAVRLGRRGIGFDISREYTETAGRRLKQACGERIQNGGKIVH